jgi:hypothetical protein
MRRVLGIIIAIPLFIVWELGVLPGGAAFLVAGLLNVTGLVERMTPLAWVVAAPLLYFAWVISYLALSALQIQQVFFRYSKPRHMIFNSELQIRKILPLLLCYLRFYTIRNLPFLWVLGGIPGVKELILLAYSPRFRFGKKSFMAGYMYDPDLIQIGDNAVVGGSAVLSAHTVSIQHQQYIYLSAPIRIGNRATVGGESRIAMGVTIGEDAVVEAGSNVLPLTQIPAGEIWGGNPAVFLRKRPGFSSAKGDTEMVRAGTTESHPEARRLVAQALGRPVDKVEDGPWDSLSQLAIAVTLQDVHGWKPRADRIVQLVSLAAITAAIEEEPGELGKTALPAPAVEEMPSDPEWLPLVPVDTADRHLACGAVPPPSGDPLPIVIAASFTAEPLAPVLTRWTASFGIHAPAQFCGFNQVLQALLDPDSSFRSNPTGINLVLLRPEDLPEDPILARQAIEQLLDGLRSFARCRLPSLPRMAVTGR